MVVPAFPHNSQGVLMRTFLVAVGPDLVGSSVGIGVPFGLMYGSSFVVR